jgi:hypothetical protein
MILVAIVAWVTVTFVFAYMRNTAAHRNDKKRERLWRMQDEILERLKERK